MCAYSQRSYEGGLKQASTKTRSVIWSTDYRGWKTSRDWCCNPWTFLATSSTHGRQRYSAVSSSSMNIWRSLSAALTSSADGWWRCTPYWQVSRRVRSMYTTCMLCNNTAYQHLISRSRHLCHGSYRFNLVEINHPRTDLHLRTNFLLCRLKLPQLLGGSL